MALVIVAMSGGIDSSLAAALLKEAGYEVIGVSLRLWSEEREDLPYPSRNCCSLEGAEDARRVCQVLDIPFYYLNLERQFKDAVVDYFCREYSRGRTPNPCLACNEKIKFHFLLRKALALGADYLATGHYARIEQQDGSYSLLKGVDPLKDQSYVLYTLGQWELSHLLFPLGGYRKAEARRMAVERGLPVAQKAESQEICFIPDNDYRRFLAERLPLEPGDTLDTQGRVLGRHGGVAFYTMGQRCRLESREPFYVLRIDPDRNTLTVGPKEDLLSDTLVADKVNFVSGKRMERPTAVTAKIRYKSPEAKAVLLPWGKQIKLHFEERQRAITPGQAVVFYQGEAVLGGGIIGRIATLDNT